MSYQRQPEAFYEGYTAYFNYNNRGTNPYPTGSVNFIEWNRGFNNGKTASKLAGINDHDGEIERTIPWTEAILLVK